MSFQERKKKIIEAVNKFESLTVMELSEKLEISPATIRRDLHNIAGEGFLIRTHGGAMKLDDRPLTSFIKKQSANDANKQEIGKLAAKFVREGDTIFLDCGSTVFKMCHHLKKMSDLKVITNSLPVIAELIDVPGISVNLIGGELDKKRKAIHGEKALNHIDSYHANKAFVGVDGFSIENGLTAFSEKEATITKAFARNADVVYLLCDSSKIGKDTYMKFAPLSMIHHLVTDKDLNPRKKKALVKEGVEIEN
jgi:DeoR family fructose operon transcriptional repressor